ncbi:uncharacterized protein LOC108911472 [Anoplophora glabripennis]|uniref:uncharacterized protein LOC108911472 n=1 Tax=Anoplophora glabripennis TaxID=217634 RepID=UPI000874A716|nr:uncharacterized protein LOC108911472 [Anoplophora glabripennis]
MLPCKNDAYTFHRNNSTNSSSSSTRSAGMQHCRRKLQDTFDETDKKAEFKAPQGDRSVLSVLSINDNTRRALRNGAVRISKTFNTVRTTFGTISQRFKISTKRRQILQEGPMTPNCATPHTFAKQVLGRTPTKLYSPFGIESPYNRGTTVDKENVPPNKQTKKITR